MPYYSDKVNDCCRDTKGIYRLTRQLLGDSGAPCLPKGGTPTALAQHFSNFFTQKIDRIRPDLHSIMYTQPLGDVMRIHGL